MGTLLSPLDLQSPSLGKSWGVQVATVFRFDDSAITRQRAWIFHWIFRGSERVDVVLQWLKFQSLDARGSLDRNVSIQGSIKGKLDLMLLSGHGVALFPNRVLYSHAGPDGTAEDLSSQMTKSSDHVEGQVIQITCKVT